MGLIALGFVFQTWVAATIILSMGISGGIVGVLALTWLQQETEIAMQGRVTSLVMFAAVALDPFSQAISGMLFDVSLTVPSMLTLGGAELLHLLSRVC